MAETITELQWHVTVAGQQLPFARPLVSAAEMREHLSVVVSGKPAGDTCVYRVPAGETACYAKVYRDRPWRLPRAQREWHNLQYLSALGVNVPALLALGCWSVHGVPYSVLVTAQVDGACDLATCAKTMPQYFADTDWFDGLCRALAQEVRSMHDGRFAHNDLNWRNILVRPDGDQPRVWLFDCPNGRRWVWPFLGFRIAKDLTHLDKMGRRYLRASQRWRFFRHYCRGMAKSPQAKALARRVLRRKVNNKYRPMPLQA